MNIHNSSKYDVHVKNLNSFSKYYFKGATNACQERRNGNNYHYSIVQIT